MQSVLDPTMGWGGRLVGCASLDIPHYIGIDSNTHLYSHCKRMVKELEKHSATKVTLFFQDALSVDYNKLKYDMVLTSPPYYNIEVYRKRKGNTDKSKEEWNTFYTANYFTYSTQILKFLIMCFALT
jgi:16S rRNA G966 N2-methylase RsmD